VEENSERRVGGGGILKKTLEIRKRIKGSGGYKSGLLRVYGKNTWDLALRNDEELQGRGEKEVPPGHGSLEGRPGVSFSKLSCIKGVGRE